MSSSDILQRIAEIMDPWAGSTGQGLSGAKQDHGNNTKELQKLPSLLDGIHKDYEIYTS